MDNGKGKRGGIGYTPMPGTVYRQIEQLMRAALRHSEESQR